MKFYFLSIILNKIYILNIKKNKNKKERVYIYFDINNIK